MALPDPEPEPELAALVTVAEDEPPEADAEPPEADAEPLEADAESLVAEAELDPLVEAEDTIEAWATVSKGAGRTTINEQGLLTDGLACCGAGARERTHRSIRVATAELGYLSLNLPGIGAANGVKIGGVRFSTNSRVSRCISPACGHPPT